MIHEYPQRISNLGTLTTNPVAVNLQVFVKDVCDGERGSEGHVKIRYKYLK